MIRRAIVLVVVLLAIVSPVWAAFSITSDIASTSLGNSPITVTLPTVNSGDFIYVWTTAGSDPGSVAYSVSDPTNGTYTKKLGLFDSTNGQGVQQFYFKNAAASTNLVITFTVSGGVFMGLYAAAIGGADTATGFDVEAGQRQVAPGTTTDAVKTGTATTTAIDYIIGTTQNTGVSPDNTGGTGFTITPHGGAGASLAVTESKTQSAAGSDQATWTQATAGGGTYLSLMMAILPSGGGGSSCPKTRLQLGVGC